MASDPVDTIDADEIITALAKTVADMTIWFRCRGAPAYLGRLDA